MTSVSIPEPLHCAACGDRIEETGYVPATEGEDGYDALVDAAVCDACGFNEVGMAGCAPELGDVGDTGTGDALLYVRLTEDGVDVIRAKD